MLFQAKQKHLDLILNYQQKYKQPDMCKSKKSKRKIFKLAPQTPSSSSLKI